MQDMEPHSRSLRAGKVPWCYEHCVRVAKAWKRLFPAEALQLFCSADYKGSTNVCPLKEPIKGACKDDLKKNFLWIKGLLQCHNKHIPSWFFLGDCFLALHRELSDKLFVTAVSVQDVRAQGLKAGGRLKCCLGCLRSMFRKNPTSYDPKARCLMFGLGSGGVGHAWP